MRSGADEEDGAHPGDEHPDPDAPLADAAADSLDLRRARRRAVAVGLALLGVAAVLFVSVLVDPVQPWVQRHDDGWRRWVVAHRTPWLVDVAEVLDRLGRTAVTLPIRLVALAVLVLRRRWTQCAAFLTAIVLSELMIGPVKALVERPRPPGALVPTTGASFPSGHAVAAAVTAFGIVVAVLPRGRRRLVWIAVAGVVAASMAWSRTYLSAHWASDTVAGVCIGVSLALLTEVAFESGRTALADRRERAPHD